VDGKKVPYTIDKLKRSLLRKDLGTQEELIELAKSYKRRPIHPIIVTPELEVADGNRRLEGLRLIGETEVEVFVTAGPVTPAELIEIAAITAMHRKDLTHFEYASAGRDWQAKTGGTSDDLAKVIDRSPGTICKLLSVWKTNAATQKAAEEGKIGVTAWYRISQAKPEEADGMLAMYLGGASQAEVDKATRKPRPTPTVHLDSIRLPLPTGTTVTVKGADLGGEELIEALASALSAARSAHKDGIDVRTLSKVLADKAKAK
jgi:ParB/RepB/Spo0J family partition protein